MNGSNSGDEPTCDPVSQALEVLREAFDDILDEAARQQLEHELSEFVYAVGELFETACGCDLPLGRATADAVYEGFGRDLAAEDVVDRLLADPATFDLEAALHPFFRGLPEPAA